MLTGCATSTPPLLDRPALQVNLTQPCDPLGALEGLTGADLTRKLIEVGEQYRVCQARHADLVKAVQP